MNQFWFVNSTYDSSDLACPYSITYCIKTCQSRSMNHVMTGLVVSDKSLTVIIQVLSEVDLLFTLDLGVYSNSETVVYVGCGEGRNEMVEVVMDFPQLAMTLHDGPAMKDVYYSCSWLLFIRAEMPADSDYPAYLAARLAFFDELSADSGYPAYIAACLAPFYKRAGKVKSLGGADCTGSVTIIGVASPSEGDFSVPIILSIGTLIIVL
ncbi:hypothetical protein MKX03_023933 [Papaver bracteatum]|nr:hypothetical protein MKX03_023933 [Papaver bracteatum]